MRAEEGGEAEQGEGEQGGGAGGAGQGHGEETGVEGDGDQSQSTILSSRLSESVHFRGKRVNWSF